MYTLLAKSTVEKDLRSIRAEDLTDLNDKIKSSPNSPGSIRPKSSRASTDIVYASGNIVSSMTSTTMPKP